MKNGKEFLILMFATVMTISSLYAPQPVQPIIAEEFGLSMSAASLLTTATMAPLAIAPVFYGYILESVSAGRVLIYSLAFLCVCQFLFFFSNTFALLVAARFLQGCAIPAVLTGIMTYISDTSEKSDVQKNIALYIAATIFGGFAGRFFSGMIAHYAGWRTMFVILGVSLAVAVYLIRSLPDNKATLTKMDPQAAKEILSQRLFLMVYIMVFFMFFMFAAILNFVPFRLRQLDPNAGEMVIGIMYTGYVMGVLVSVNIMKIIRLLGSELRTVFAGLTMFVVSLLLFISSDTKLMFLGMFLFCASMFMSHTAAAGYVNKIAEKHKGVTNGLYVAFYYSGGAIGSVLPGLVYQNFGWNTFLLMLGVVMSSAILTGRLVLRSYMIK
ncbi:MFS transporter [Seleniivibrio woodruffii]|uniref:YNFM family putative membrane transporter n=1 Tax=Seleniivibrio woodruffii TaxID=1078050 RepID=A0A4V2PRL7_9BACT|nr:MFS transporter [Seleniivibrio woodruffii]TCK59381.1 YNFM family putative membrane transporter [Seleniivibrio woodruffii]TVZ35578.1 YNFM family putative membrane transporter [Seleniivibrio woodruffii]